MLKLKLSLISTLKKYKIFLRLGLYFLVFVIVFVNAKNKVLSYPAPLALDYLKPIECGVVLTGAPGRIREAFEVFTQKKISKLVISGVYKDAKLREIFPLLPFYPEVDPENIILEKISGSTFGNANQSLLVVETLKCTKILLMTSDIHMYRALKTFKSVFPPSIEIEAYAIQNQSKENSLFDIHFETFKVIFYDIILFLNSYMN